MTSDNEHLRITRVPAMPVPMVRPEFVVPDTAQYIYTAGPTQPTDNTLPELNLLQKLQLLWKSLPHLFNMVKGITMKNWKTTVTGIVGAIAIVANTLFGVVVPQEALIATAIFVIGLFAGDGNKE